MPASPEKETLQRQQQLPLSVLKSDDSNDNKLQMVIIGDKNHNMEESRTVNIENQQQWAISDYGGSSSNSNSSTKWLFHVLWLVTLLVFDDFIPILGFIYCVSLYLFIL